jgi:4a-hydroxytetrahydrobiopterin dehydratase
MELHEQRCVPCRGGVPPLAPQRCAELHAQLRDWALIENHHLEKEWRFPDFAAALAFVNRAGAVCEAEGHHADFELCWGRARARIWTHKVDGLTESDFVLAAKLDRI